MHIHTAQHIATRLHAYLKLVLAAALLRLLQATAEALELFLHFTALLRHPLDFLHPAAARKGSAPAERTQGQGMVKGQCTYLNLLLQ